MKYTKLASLLFVPLAFCATVPESNSQNNDEAILKDQAALLTFYGLGQELSVLLEQIGLVADDALATYKDKDTIQNWPNNLSEMVDLVDAQIAVDSSFTGFMRSSIQNIISTVSKSFNRATQPFTDGIPFRGVVPPKPDAKHGPTDDTSVEAITKGILGAIDSTSKTTNTDFDELANGIVDAKLLNETVAFVAQSIAEVLNGKKNITEVINESVDDVVKLSGQINPLGKFIENLANYLAKHPDSSNAAVNKLTAFVASILDAISEVSKKMTANLSPQTVDAIGKLINGILAKLIVGAVSGMRQAQKMTAADFTALQGNFLEVIRAQTSPATYTYTQQLLHIIDRTIQKAFSIDPAIVAVLSNPSEGNIRRLVIAVAKALVS